MTSKTKILFNLNVSPSKVKTMTLHPRKQWVAIINTSNTFSLWNYRHKVLIKSFNCNTLDQTKNLEIKDIVFYDKYSLPYTKNIINMKNHLIFVSSFKIFFYDYVTDGIKQVNQKQMEQKTIRKVCAYTQNKICISLNDGSFKILDNKDLYSKNSMIIKSIRGYHIKPISWIIPYCANHNEMPRIITVGSQDSLMACWNIETILNMSNSENASPSFKFLMQKGSKSDSNNGEQIISVHYDSTSYRLITLTHSYLTVWSTMTGMELKRLKNTKFAEVMTLNHFSFGMNTFLAHSNKTEILVVRQQNSEYQIEDAIDMRSYVKDDPNIISIRVNCNNPAELSVMTSTCLVVIEIDKFYRCGFGVSPNFSTILSTVNAKNFIIKGQHSFKPDITPQSVSKITFEKEILFNCFYLNFQAGWINFNLVEIQYQNMLLEQRKYKMKQIDPNSPLNLNTVGQSLIEVSYDGVDFFLFSKQANYYEIYSASQTKKYEDLLSMDSQQPHLDFHSPLKLVGSGFARDIVWHQYKNQIGVMKGVDKNGKLVQYEKPEKKTIFSRSDKRCKLSGEIKQWVACIYKKNQNTNQYQPLFRSKPITSKLYRIINLGFLFGYSVEKNGSEYIEFINDEKSSNKQVEGAPYWPEKVFSSYCESFHIYAYDGYFIIYRVEQNGNLCYFRMVCQTILQGIFWDKLFFFKTKDQLYFLQITSNDIVMIKLADSMVCGTIEVDQQLFKGVDDDLEASDVASMPPGQLQFMGIVNNHLILLDYLGHAVFISLKSFPYIEFCIQLVSGYTDRIQNLYKKANQNIRKLMKQACNNYGLPLSDY